jgi:predicted RecB family nuclease
MNPTITDVPGIGPTTAEALAEHRIKTVRALANASLEKIAAVPGFSEARAAKVKAAAAALLANRAAGAPLPEEAPPEETPEKTKQKADKKDKKKEKKDKKGKKPKKGKKNKGK